MGAFYCTTEQLITEAGIYESPLIELANNVMY